MNTRNIKSSYRVKLKNLRHALDATVDIYRNVVKFLIPVVRDHWYEIKDLPDKTKYMYVEHLVHTTKSNKAVYPSFDKKFYKLPSYFRRDAIEKAVAHYKGYLELHKDDPSVFLNFNPDVLPCFYKKNMFIFDNYVFRITTRNRSLCIR